jgi:hypothetical protein
MECAFRVPLNRQLPRKGSAMITALELPLLHHELHFAHTNFYPDAVDYVFWPWYNLSTNFVFASTAANSYSTVENKNSRKENSPRQPKNKFEFYNYFATGSFMISDDYIGRGNEINGP